MQQVLFHDPIFGLPIFGYGMMLFLGTMFAPTIDRFGPGQGFTHAVGDVVEVSTPLLGRLVNRVEHTDRIAPWTFGTAALMANLARRGLL